MWPICSFSLPNILWLLGPLILGLLTAWWAWGGRGRVDTDVSYAEPEPVRTITPAPQPVSVPTPPPVAPVAFTAPTPPAASVAAAVPVAAAALTAIGIPAAIGAADDLLQIKGVGPKLNELLNSLGVHRFDQIAKWGSGDVSKVDEHLGAFTGRIERDSWIEQAGLLARGAIAEFEAKFGKLDSENQ
jgi:predicted flap endonuclease-1-like 5' DNA nuclease